LDIWYARPSLDELNGTGERTLVRHLGIVFSEIGEDYLCGTMPVDARTFQPMGLLHGGASVVLAESLGSTGANLCVDHSAYVCLGQEINANHLRSARLGTVTGTARPVHLGGRSHVWSIEIADEAGRLVCVSRLTIAVLRRAALAGERDRGPP
jgi:1,4-dihydroxy-2-naphthoyl-CoA hydrolase